MKLKILSLLVVSVILSTASSAVSEEEASKEVAPECLISKGGIAGVKPGDTLKELKEKVAKLSEDLTLENIEDYMVDLSAVAVMRGRETLFYAVFFAGEHTDLSAEIAELETDNPRFRTAEGVGPGSLIADAARVYGEVELGYNTENESREGVSFKGEKAPPQNIHFSPGAPALSYGFAGVYKESADSFVQTSEYHPFAVILKVGVGMVFE